MRRNLLSPCLTVLLFLCFLSANSQREAWIKEGVYTAIAVDLAGNLLAAKSNTLIKLDTSGNVLWTQSYAHGFTSLCYIPDGSIYGSGGNKLTKLSSTGDLIWEVANSDGTVTAGTNDAIYVGSVLSFTKYNGAGVAQFTRTLNPTSLVGVSTISADKAGNLHANFSTNLFESFTVNGFPVNTFADSRIVYNASGNIATYQSSFAGGSYNYSRGYKARNNATDFVYTSFRSFLSTPDYQGYLDGCAVPAACLTALPVNPDFDNYGRKYFAGTYTKGVYGDPCTNLTVNLCNGSTTGALNKAFVSVPGGARTLNAGGNTKETLSYIAAGQSGQSLYAIGSWTANTTGSTFTFAGNSLSTPGGFLLRYSIDPPAAAPLPIVSLSLSGKSIAKTNILTWQTLSETNSDHFVLERAEDGIRYSSIATVNSKATNGNSAAAITYDYKDNSIPSRMAYYRIKQVDKDGKFAYSNVISLQSMQASFVSLYPNPAKQSVRLSINTETAGKIYILILDAVGKEVVRTVSNAAAGSNYIDINLPLLSPGNYVVRVIAGNKTETLKLVKE